MANSTFSQRRREVVKWIEAAGRKAVALPGDISALAQNVAKKGIRVNAVAPGPVWTPLQSSGGQPQDSIETFGEDTPLGRPGQPAEFGPLYVFLASQELNYVTGQVYGATDGDGLM